MNASPSSTLLQIGSMLANYKNLMSDASCSNKRPGGDTVQASALFLSKRHEHFELIGWRLVSTASGHTGASTYGVMYIYYILDIQDEVESYTGPF